MMKRDEIQIFTDGSCYAMHPDKLGGSGAYILWEGCEIMLQKGYKNTTIDRREIYAITMALRKVPIKRPTNVSLYIDRQNVANSLRSEYIKWYQTGEFEIKNKELWIELFEEIKKRKRMRLQVFWIEGHQKNDNLIALGNNIADILSDYKQFNEYEIDLE